MDSATLVVLAVFGVLFGAAILWLAKRNTNASPTDLSAVTLSLQQVSGAVQEISGVVHQMHTETAVLSQKVAQVETLVPSFATLKTEVHTVVERTATVEKTQNQIGSGLVLISQNLAKTAEMTRQLTDTSTAIHKELNVAKTDLTALAERVAKIDGNQNNFNHGMVALGNQLTSNDGVTKGLVQAAAAIRNELASAKTDLTRLHAEAKARHEIEQRSADALQHLESVIAGTQSKGAAGENILEAIFSKLPIEWQVRDFTVNNKPCEFGLRLPNNLVLPIDSKWAATHLLERFIACDEIAAQQKIKEEIEAAVLTKAKEVKKYIDPTRTPSFGVAVVPDAIYQLCTGMMCEAFSHNVVLISHSMFMPYLMLVFQTMHKNSQSLDLGKLDRQVTNALETVQSLQHEIEGPHARGLTMINNSRDKINAHLSRLQTGLGSIHHEAVDAAEDVSPPVLALEAT